jgi:hypothetical protein
MRSYCTELHYLRKLSLVITLGKSFDNVLAIFYFPYRPCVISVLSLQQYCKTKTKTKIKIRIVERESSANRELLEQRRN